LKAKLAHKDAEHRAAAAKHADELARLRKKNEDELAELRKKVAQRDAEIAVLGADAAKEREHRDEKLALWNPDEEKRAKDRAATDNLPVTLHPSSKLTPVQSRALWDAFERVCILVATGWSAKDVRDAVQPGSSRSADLLKVRMYDLRDAFKAGSGHDLYKRVAAELRERLPSHPVLGTIPNIAFDAIQMQASALSALQTMQSSREYDLSVVSKPAGTAQDVYNRFKSAYDDLSYRQMIGEARSNVIGAIGNELNRLSREMDRAKDEADRCQAAYDSVKKRPFHTICGMCGRENKPGNGCSFAGQSQWTYQVYHK
jgi:hypothetical protein